MTPVIPSLTKSIQELVIIEPSADSNEVINQGQLDALRAQKRELTTALGALVLKTTEDFAYAGEMVDAVGMLVEMIDEKLAQPTADANRRHKALTGTRKETAGELEDLVRALRNKRAVWKAADDARVAREKADKERVAREAAEAAQREAAAAAKREADRIAAAAAEADRVAREAAAAEAARQAEIAAEAARAAAEAALAAEAIEDPDAAMEAAAAAQEAAEAAAEQAAQAERERIAREEQAEAERQAREAEAAAARRAAEAAAQAPVVIERVHVAPAAPVEEGVSWADNWTAEYDEVEALKALVAAGAVEYLMVNIKAINAAAKSQKSLARIPGVRVVNNKIERRR